METFRSSVIPARVCVRVSARASARACVLVKPAVMAFPAFSLLLALLAGVLPHGPAPVAGLRRSVVLNAHELELLSLNATRVPGAGAQPIRANSSFALMEMRFTQSQAQNLVTRVASDLARAALGARSNPDSVLVTLWMVLFCVCAARVWMLSGGTEYEARSIEVRERRDSLQGAYVLAMADIEGVLVNMSESAVSLAEWNFNEKRKSFLRGLERIGDDPEKYFPKPTKGTVDAFRTFASLWLRIFEECTEDPIRNPKRIVEQRELDRCKRISDIVRLVVGRLEDNPVSFVRRYASDGCQDPKQMLDDGGQQPWLQVFCGFGCSRRAISSKMGDDPLLGKAPAVSKGGFPSDLVLGCIRLTLLSKTHILLLATYLAGLSLLAIELVQCGWFSAIMVGFSEVYLLSGLFRIRDIDEICRLQREVARLEQMSEEVKEHRNMLVEFYSNLRELNILWQYRTLPCLEQLEAISEHITREKDPAFLREATSIWCRLFDGLGDVPLWMERSIDEEVLGFAAEQMKSATDFVMEHTSKSTSKDVLQRLGNVFGFVVIRIRAAQNLTTRGFNKLVAPAEPFVTISISDDQKPLSSSDTSIADSAFRTDVAKGCVDPKWEDEEFFVPVEWYNSHLQLHVWDSQAHKEPMSLGFHNIAFRSLRPGVWYQRSERLASAKKGAETQSAIEFEVFFADEIRQLDWADAEPHATAARAPALTF